ncbi:hypothetical protein D9M68_430380 [compost metagenome]
MRWRRELPKEKELLFQLDSPLEKSLSGIDQARWAAPNLRLPGLGRRVRCAHQCRDWLRHHVKPTAGAHSAPYESASSWYSGNLNRAWSGEAPDLLLEHQYRMFDDQVSL